MYMHTEACKVRHRAPRFSGEEVEILLDEVIAKKTVLFGRHSKLVSEEKKNILWNGIVRKVNSVSRVIRTREELERKVKHFTSESKQKHARIHRQKIEGVQPGEALEVLNSLEEKALEFLGIATNGGIIPGGQAVPQLHLGTLEDSTPERLFKEGLEDCVGLLDSSQKSRRNTQSLVLQSPSENQQLANYMEIYAEQIKLEDSSDGYSETPPSPIQPAPQQLPPHHQQSTQESPSTSPSLAGDAVLQVQKSILHKLTDIGDKVQRHTSSVETQNSLLEKQNKMLQKQNDILEGHKSLLAEHNRLMSRMVEVMAGREDED